MILLTNIGNRNITFKGKMYFETIGKEREDVSFINWTKNLLNNYETHKDDLEINIINPLIEQGGISKIVLFYSDQSRLNTRIDQDTIYEAQIIKNILVETYNFLAENIETRCITCKVIDNGALMQYYRNELKRIKSRTDNKILICDAGGTAQQKMALKIMAEYILKKDNYSVVYTESNNLVTDVNVDEYRSVINQEEAIRLIHNGQYTAAANLLDYFGLELFHKLGKKEWKKKVFGHVFWRFVGNSVFARRNVSGLKLRHPILKSYEEKNPLIKTPNLLAPISIDKVFQIIDKFHKSYFYYSIENYSMSILTFSQFYEMFFQALLSLNYPKMKYGDPSYSTKEKREAFEKKIIEQIPDTIELVGRINMNDLSLQCLIGKRSKNETISKLCTLLSPYIEYSDDYIKGKTISSFRNRIAHTGLFISTAMIETKLDFYPPLLDKISDLIGFKYKNTFHELNLILEETLRQ